MARLAEARRAAEELDCWALARAYRWAADQALLGRAHLQDLAHDPLDIRYTESWPGLEGVAGPRMPAIPPEAARDEFRPLGGREPPVRRVQLGEGAGEFRQQEQREPPCPLPPLQQPIEGAPVPTVRDAFRPPGGLEPPSRYAAAPL